MSASLDLIEFVNIDRDLYIHIPDGSMVESVLIREHCQLPNDGLRTRKLREDMLCIFNQISHKYMLCLGIFFVP